MRLTIAEFAKKYGADKAFILENLETVFASYVVKEKGLTMLDEKAVEVLQPPEAEEQHTEPQKSRKETEAQKQETEPPAVPEEQTEAELEEAEEQAETEPPEAEEQTETELEEARAQIAQLKAELEAERASKKETEKRLLDMMDKVLELTKNAQKLTENAQKLTAIANNRPLLEDGSKERRLGFFKRLFGKKEKPLP